MFNVGGPEVLVILLVALVVLGPQQLPKAVRSVGNVMAELRRMSSGFQEEIRNAMDGPIEAEAREQGARLAQRPEDADITETVARNDGLEPAPDLAPSAPSSGSTASTTWSSTSPGAPAAEQQGVAHPSDRASG